VVLDGLMLHLELAAGVSGVAHTHGLHVEDVDLEEVTGCLFIESQCHRITESHRMVGVGRDFCGSPSPTHLPKQGHLEQAAQDFVQVGLEYLQRRRIHSLSGQPVPVLCHPQSEKVLPHVQKELPLLQFVPVSPCPVASVDDARSSSITTALCSVSSKLVLH